MDIVVVSFRQELSIHISDLLGIVPADGLEALSLTRNQSNVDPAEPPDHVAELERSLTGLDPSLEIEKLHESSPLGHASDKSMLDSGSKRSPFDPDPSLDAGNTSQTEASDNAAKKIPHLYEQPESKWIILSSYT